MSLILIDSVFKIDKHYYPQIILEDCKYQNKMSSFIDEGIEVSSDEFDEEVSDEE